MGAITSRAEALWQAKNYSGSGALLDENNSHDAQLGSTSGADTNDPLFLAHSGTQYIFLPGTIGNAPTTPDSVALSVTGDIDIRLQVAADDWNPGAIEAFIAKYNTAGQRSYRFSYNTTGKFRFRWSEDGNSTKSFDSSVSTGFAAGTLKWIRVTLDVDNGATQHEVKFYTSDNGTDWTQLGTTQTGSGTTSIFDGTATLRICSSSTGGDSAGVPGKYHRVQVYSGIDGTLEFDANFTNTVAITEPFAAFTEDSLNAATVTINHSSIGRKATVVGRPMFLLGTDDYFEVPDDANLDFAGGDDLTVMLVGRSYDVTPGSDQALLAKKTNFTTAAGYALKLDTGGTSDGVIADGSNSSEDASSALTDGQLFTVTMVRNTSDDDVEAFLDGTGSGSPTTDATTATLANAEVLRIGSVSDTAGSYFDGELVAAAVWREALSDADVVRAGNELLRTQFATHQMRQMGHIQASMRSLRTILFLLFGV